MAMELLVLFEASGLRVTDYDACVRWPGEEPAAVLGLVAVALERCRHTLAQRYIGRGRLRFGGER
jgi:hypothetical protein